MASQAFNQVVLAAGYVSEEKLELAVSKINRSMDAKLTLSSARAKANAALNPLGMDLAEVRDDFREGKRHFVVVMHDSIPLFLNKTIVSSVVGVQIKKMLAEMFKDHSCRGIREEDLAPSVFPDKNEIISQYLGEKRFERLESNILIGTRLLYEIEDYLKEQFEGKTLFRCMGCEEWFLHGTLCSNRECTARLHRRCYDAYFSSKSLPPGTCPLCSSHL